MRSGPRPNHPPQHGRQSWAGHTGSPPRASHTNHANIPFQPTKTHIPASYATSPKTKRTTPSNLQKDRFKLGTDLKSLSGSKYHRISLAAKNWAAGIKHILLILILGFMCIFFLMHFKDQLERLVVH